VGEILINSMLIIVKVNQFRVKVPVGFYPEEREIKTEVLIDVQIRYNRENIQDKLDNVIDYQLIDEVLLRQKNVEIQLLETLAENIINELTFTFGVFDIQSIAVEITKPQILHSYSNNLNHQIFVEKFLK
jgi:dihydroneopterin aldolase